MNADLLRLEQAEDNTQIESLYCQAFGPGRFARTAYRLRERADYAHKLSCVVEEGGNVVGTIRFSKIMIGGKGGALLLGPLVISQESRGHNYGVALMTYGVKLAKAAGFKLVILVGDLSYYRKAGFIQVPDGQIKLPGPFDPNRLLAYEIQTAILDQYRGLIRSVC